MFRNSLLIALVSPFFQNKKYHSREDFLQDVSLIVENSIIYNGEDDYLTKNAKKVLGVIIDRFAENEEKLMKLEKDINPLLDDDSQVGKIRKFIFSTC